MAITADDELLHPVEDPSPHWSDSLYFNAWDPESDLFFITRMAIRANESASYGGLLAWLDGTPVYGNGQTDPEMPQTNWDEMTVGPLVYRMDEPLHRWTVRLDDPDHHTSGAVTWQGTSGCFDYRENRQPLPRAVAWGHYEQSCRVTGTFSVAGREIALDGLGQRDHSWGFRDWGGVREWHWVTGLLGPERSFNLFHLVAADGAVTVNGFVHDRGRDVGIAEAERATVEEEGRSPTSFSLRLVTDEGDTYDVEGERAAMEVPVVEGEGTVVHEVPMRMASGGHEGFGMYELLENDTRRGTGDA